LLVERASLTNIKKDYKIVMVILFVNITPEKALPTEKNMNRNRPMAQFVEQSATSPKFRIQPLLTLGENGKKKHKS
jgi:hypothetical protein